jgi:hypothetical protein
MGAQGVQGPTGSPGIQGPTGSPGIQGATGSGPTKTVGDVYSSTTSYLEVVTLEFDINTLLDGGESNKFKLPDSNVIGKEVIVINNYINQFYATSLGTNNMFVDITTFNNGPGIITAPNSGSSLLRSYYGERIKFICVGNNTWIVEQFVQNPPTINGKLLGGAGINAFNTHGANNATASLSTTTLNTFYSDSSTQYGFQVVCRSIIGGGLIYTKTGTASWASTPILDNALAAGLTSSGIVPSFTTRTFKTIITTAQVLQLFTTPVVILPSQSGVARIPTHIYIKRNTGTAYTLNTNAFLVLDQFDSSTNNIINPNPLTSTAGYCSNTISLLESVTGGFFSGNYKLKAAGGNPTLGTGDLDVYVTYNEIRI